MISDVAMLPAALSTKHSVAPARQAGYRQFYRADPVVINRRAFLSAAAGMTINPASAALPTPPGKQLAFRLMRHGTEIGRHMLTFESLGDQLTVRITVDALVTLLSVPIVRYRHRAVETWQRDILASLTGETDKNGQHEWMNVQRGREGLVVRGSKTPQYVAPDPVGCTSYWNKHFLDAPMISLEDGVLLRPTVIRDRTESIPLASGATIAADHFSLSGPFNVDVWYDQASVWAGFAVTVADGSNVHYERL